MVYKTLRSKRDCKDVTSSTFYFNIDMSNFISRLRILFIHIIIPRCQRQTFGHREAFYLSSSAQVFPLDVTTPNRKLHQLKLCNNNSTETSIG